MQRLQWACTAVAGKLGQPWYDVVQLDRICKPIFLQPHPGRKGFFFYNHFV